MEITFKVQKKHWKITSDSNNYVLTPEGRRKDTNEMFWNEKNNSYFDNLGNLLSSLYQKGLRDSDSVTSFRELAEHSKHVQSIIDDIHGKLLYELPFKPPKREISKAK